MNNKKYFNKNFIKESEINLYVNFSINNIICTATSKDGKVLFWMSPGCLNFKGHRKSTPIAAFYLVKRLEEALWKKKINKVNLKLKHDSENRMEFLNYLFDSKINIIKIEERASVPFNGCRPQKRKKI